MAFPKEKSEQQVIERALARLTGLAATAAAELSATSVRNLAEALPMPIRIQLNNAIEELDLGVTTRSVQNCTLRRIALLAVIALTGQLPDAISGYRSG